MAEGQGSNLSNHTDHLEEGLGRLEGEIRHRWWAACDGSSNKMIRGGVGNKGTGDWADVEGERELEWFRMAPRFLVWTIGWVVFTEEGNLGKGLDTLNFMLFANQPITLARSMREVCLKVYILDQSVFRWPLKPWVDTLLRDYMKTREEGRLRIELGGP